jgi:RHS repeat-associated protein
MSRRTLAAVIGSVVQSVIIGAVRADSPSPRRPRAARHSASAGLPVLLALLWPVQALAQTNPAVVVEYYHLDALGSVRVVTDQNGQILKNAAGVEVGRHDFLPFGEEWNSPASAKEKKLFTGHERDAETGLDYFGARYYRPQVGRFTTIDPVYSWSENLTDPQRWNRYAYVRNNPLKFTDPDGRIPLWVTGGIGAAAYGGWTAYVNVQNGRPWYQDIGVEAGKGFLVGATLGLAAPALVATDLGVGTATVALDAAALGRAREALVAQLVGGRVAGDVKVTLQGVGTTAVDVYGKAGEFVGVGGPAKAINLSLLGSKLKQLAGAAEDAGVTAQYYFAKGTPEAAIKLAQKWLGKENVFLFEMKQ